MMKLFSRILDESVQYKTVFLYHQKEKEIEIKYDGKYLMFRTIEEVILHMGAEGYFFRGFVHEVEMNQVYCFQKVVLK